MLKEINANKWDMSFLPEKQIEATKSLEAGNILLFPNLSFNLKETEEIYLSPIYANKKTKNISYNNRTDKLNGAIGNENDKQQIKMMLQRFATYANILIANLFPHYVSHLQIGRTSFRPVEISGRVTSYRKDDTRLHVDSFPATPTKGHRILRVFSNINLNGQDRVWRTGESFADVIKQYLPLVPKHRPFIASILHKLKITKTYRTEYDHTMLHIHNNMKANMDYQLNVQQATLRFAPGTTWIVQTDHVSHAAMSGQHLLEQTFYLPVSAMLQPELSPLKTLEQALGRALV